MKRILLLILTLLFIQSLFCVPDNYREALAIVIRDLSDYTPTDVILDDGRAAGQVIHSTIEETEPSSHIVDLARQVYSDMITYYGTTETVTGDLISDEITALSIALSQYGVVATGSRIDDRNTLFDLIIDEGVALAPKFHDLDQWLPAQYTYATELDGLMEDVKADYDAYNVGLGGSFDGSTSQVQFDAVTITDGDYIEFKNVTFTTLSTSNDRSLFGKAIVESYIGLGSSGSSIRCENNNNEILSIPYIFAINTKYDIVFGLENYKVWTEINGSNRMYSASSWTENTITGTNIGNGYSSNFFQGSIASVNIVINDDSALYIPNPATGYDTSGNDNHGTPTNVTQTDIAYYGYCQQFGFNQYLKNTTAGVASIASDMAYGVVEFDILKETDGNTVRSFFIADRIGITNASQGYYIIVSNDERLYFAKNNIGSNVQLFGTIASYIDINTLYNIKVTRNKTTDQYITGPIGTFAVWIRGGAFGSDYVLVDTSGGSGTNPVTDNTYTTSKYFVNDLDTGDMVGNAQLTDVDGNIRYLPNEISEWNVNSGAYETHTVPGLADESNIDALGNACRYEAATGIMPSGKTEFNPTDIADTQLEPFNLKATISNVLGLPTYWKDEVLSETTVYDPTESFRHENKYLEFDYFHALMTRKGLRKLFEQEIADSLHLALKNILNYSSARTDDDVYRIYRFYKMLDFTEYDKYYGYYDESNSKFDTGFQDSWCIAGYDFLNNYSLFGSDDQFETLDNTIYKILDVGAGGADSVSYFDVTQATAGSQANRTQYGILADGVDDTYTIGDIDSVKAIVWKAKYGTFTEELLTLGPDKELILQDTAYMYSGGYLGFSIYGSPSTSEFTVNAIVFVGKQDADAVKLFTDGTGFGNIEIEHIKFFDEFEPAYNIFGDTEIIDDAEYYQDIESLY